MTFARVNGAGWTDDTTTVTAAQLNQLDTNVTNAIDGLSGGTYTPAGVIQINGAGSTAAIGGAAPATFGGAAGGVLLSETAGVASNVRLASRDVTRTIVLLPFEVGTWTRVLGGWRQNATAHYLQFPLKLPHGQILDTVTAQLTGADYTATWPLVAMPYFDVIWQNKLTGAVVGSSAGTDASASAAAYKAAHAITKAGIGHTIDMVNYCYMIQFIGEDEAPYVAGSVLHSISTDCICTGYTEY